MKRIPEPEIMDDPEQARAYAAADFTEAHQVFVARFDDCFPGRLPRRVLDLGCGPADVTIRFARRYPDCHITAVDASAPMLDLARAAIDAAGLAHRIALVCARVPDAGLARHAFDTVISNSLLHHLADPQALWETVNACAAPGACVFIGDLARPDSLEAARALVERYAHDAPAILRRDFLNSLLAAWRVHEVQQQLGRAELGGLRVSAAGDRHLLVCGERP